MEKNCFDYLLIAFLAVCAFALPARAETVVVVCKSDFVPVLLFGDLRPFLINE